MMKNSRFFLSLLSAFGFLSVVSSFVPDVQRGSLSNQIVSFKATRESSDVEMEAERLLRMAKKLRQQAEQAEQAIHKDLYKKKVAEDEQLDHWIQYLLEEGGSRRSRKQQIQHTVNRLHDKCPCMDTLEHMIDRLHERQLIARGQEHVEAHFSKHDNRAEFERISHAKNEEEAERLVGLIRDLISAVEILDQEFQLENYGKPISHTDEQHWGGDHKAQQLNNRWHEIRREHEEQFLKRQESYVEAQRIKKDNKPLP
jgi:phage shock protein A